LTDAGEVYSWGKGDDGQLGQGDNVVECSSPTLISQDNFNNEKVTRVAMGFSHTTFLTENNTLYGCGDNAHGQTGVGHCGGVKTHPTQCKLPSSALTAPTTVACGDYHTVVLTSGGIVYTCGNNSFGQLGRATGNNKTAQSEFAVVSVDNTPDTVLFVEVAAGAWHTVLLSDQWEVYTCGWNAYGQVGVGHPDTVGDEVHTLHKVSLPQQQQQIPKWASISAGCNHTACTMGWEEDKSQLYTWGRGDYGSLGSGTENDQFTPLLVECEATVVSCGVAHTVVQQEDQLVTFGNGEHGQLGGSTKDNGKLHPTVVWRNDESALPEHIAAGRYVSVLVTNTNKTINPQNLYKAPENNKNIDHKLVTEQTALKKEHDNLQEQYSQLQSEHEQQIQQYQELQLKHKLLLQQHELLQEQHRQVPDSNKNKQQQLSRYQFGSMAWEYHDDKYVPYEGKDINSLLNATYASYKQTRQPSHVTFQMNDNTYKVSFPDMVQINEKSCVKQRVRPPHSIHNVGGPTAG